MNPQLFNVNFVGLTGQQVEVLATSLLNMPMHAVEPMVNTLRLQMQAQLAPPAPQAPTEENTDAPS